MLTKLFWQDPYLTECKAKVMSIEGKKIKVDQTIFFAFSGGQESDSGTIGGINVVNALKQGDKETIIDIEYELEKKPNFKIGDEVEIRIDKTRREKVRKLHSAAHIVYYFVIETVGKLKIIGSNIAEEKARIDFVYDKPLNEVLPEIQARVNKFLQENHAIVTRDDEKKPDVRWWTCNEWKMPCGGIHPKSTGEIGNLELKRKNIGSGKERIEIRLKC